MLKDVLKGHSPDCVLNVCLVADDMNNPCAEFLFSSGIVKVPLTTVFETHYCNEYLRSMDTGIDVGFATYEQYAELLDIISNRILGKICALCK
ncbi:MAG: hypothetical protein M0R40_06770 [Firmicutes bacterium]|nr:hypothetical protein [Bacillota bacterium]